MNIEQQFNHQIRLFLKVNKQLNRTKLLKELAKFLKLNDTTVVSLFAGIRRNYIKNYTNELLTEILKKKAIVKLKNRKKHKQATTIQTLNMTPKEKAKRLLYLFKEVNKDWYESNENILNNARFLIKTKFLKEALFEKKSNKNYQKPTKRNSKYWNDVLQVFKKTCKKCLNIASNGQATQPVTIKLGTTISEASTTKPKLIDCLKCPNCGHSWTPED